MGIETLIRGAIELGVIPMVALFLVYAMHLQNKRLTAMLEKQEQNNMDVVKLLIQEVTQFGKFQLSRGSEANNVG